MSDNPKAEAIRAMNSTYQRGQDLEFELIFTGEQEAAKDTNKSNKTLSDEIDKLIVDAMKSWLKDANQVTKDVKKANASLQSAITAIKNTKKKGENIVKAVGLIDDVASIAKSLLA